MQLSLNFSPYAPGLNLAYKALEGKKSRKLASLDLLKIITTHELKEGLRK